MQCKTVCSKCNCYDGNNFPGIPLLHVFESSGWFNLRGCPAQAQQEPRALRAARAQAGAHPARTRSRLTRSGHGRAAGEDAELGDLGAGGQHRSSCRGSPPAASPHPRGVPRKPRGRAGASTHLFGAVLALHLRRDPGRRGCGTGESGAGGETRTSSARRQPSPAALPAVRPAPPPFVAAPAPPGGPRAGAAPPLSRVPQFPRPELPRERRRPPALRAAPSGLGGGAGRAALAEPRGVAAPAPRPWPRTGSGAPPPHPRLVRAPRTEGTRERAGASRGSSAPRQKKTTPTAIPRKPRGSLRG